MPDPKIDRDHADRMVRSCQSLDELAGYEAQARFRGIAPHEIEMIYMRRRQLTPKK